ncbi:hypothetical protein JX266_001316 [Neoarthrinium moseri]|nr:hypothetical protein JX266_001316 [Neoarthrinium moseri]
MPTPDPKDPLNLPEWRKWLVVGALCFFGALALTIEHVVGGLIPIFVLEYSGIDPKTIIDHPRNVSTSPTDNMNGLDSLSNLGGPSISQVTLLSTLPLAINGIASFFLVPISAAIGRRPVILIAGILPWIGGLWAGFSTSLGSHLAARCLQGFGVGTVEALIPLMIQDLMFIHKRNKALATLWSSQGILIICLGISSPFIVAQLSWRHLYWIYSGIAACAWLAIILLVPESRWERSKEELAGNEVYPLRPGKDRPHLDHEMYGRRTRWTDFGIFNIPLRWSSAVSTLWNSVRCIIFPNIIWIIALSSVASGAFGAFSQTQAAVLLAAGWDFKTLGLAGLTMIAATPFILLSAHAVDMVGSWMARRNGGQREPEFLLPTLLVPVIISIVGFVVYSYGAANIATGSSIVILTAFFLMTYGAGTASTILTSYLIESHPDIAASVLVTVSSLRHLVGFLLNFRATDWIKSVGFIRLFSIYSSIFLAIAVFGMVIYFRGKQWRAWGNGKIRETADRGMLNGEKV